MKKSKEMILSYFLSQLTAMEEDVYQLQSRVRTRRIDVNDNVELIIALVRLELMRQVAADISVFLRIENNKIK